MKPQFKITVALRYGCDLGEYTITNRFEVWAVGAVRRQLELVDWGNWIAKIERLTPRFTLHPNDDVDDRFLEIDMIEFKEMMDGLQWSMREVEQRCEIGAVEQFDRVNLRRRMRTGIHQQFNKP